MTPDGDNLTSGGMFWIILALLFAYFAIRRLLKLRRSGTRSSRHVPTQPDPDGVKFPLTVKWDNGEVETFADIGHLQCNLEDYDSESEPESTLTDAEGFP